MDFTTLLKIPYSLFEYYTYNNPQTRQQSVSSQNPEKYLQLVFTREYNIVISNLFIEIRHSLVLGTQVERYYMLSYCYTKNYASVLYANTWKVPTYLSSTYTYLYYLEGRMKEAHAELQVENNTKEKYSRTSQGFGAGDATRKTLQLFINVWEVISARYKTVM